MARLAFALLVTALVASAACSGSTSNGAQLPLTPCAAEGFTACVDSCSWPADLPDTAADCVDGYYRCEAPRVPAAACPAGTWTVDGSVTCGPWLGGRDCPCAPECRDGAWVCPPLSSTCGQ
jgi:hypothetical protein